MTDFISNAFDILFGNAFNLNFYDGLILIIILLAIIFSIQDYRIGLMTLFIMSISLYVYGAINNYSLTNITLMVFVSLLLLAFSLIISRTSSYGGGLL